MTPGGTSRDSVPTVAPGVPDERPVRGGERRGASRRWMALAAVLAAVSGCGGGATEPPGGIDAGRVDAGGALDGATDAAATDAAATDAARDAGVAVDVGTDAPPDAAPPCDPSIDLLVDPMHCGRCWRDCMGGACVDGRCEAVVLVDLERGADDLATDGVNLYVIHGEGRDPGDPTPPPTEILSIPLSGGEPAVLARQADAPTREWARLIATDGTNVYWSEVHGSGSANAIRSIPVRGAASASVVALTSFPRHQSIATNGIDVVWTAGDGTVRARAVDGSSSVRTLATGFTADRMGDIHVDGSSVYFAGVRSAIPFVEHVATDATGGRIVAEGARDSGTRFALGADAVLVVNDEGEIHRVARTGGPTVVLASFSPTSSDGEVRALAADAARLYVLTLDGISDRYRVWSVPVGGGPRQHLADVSCMPGRCLTSRHVALSDRAIFFGDFYDGRIYRLAK